MTVSISDMTVPPQKPEMIKQAQDTVDLITKNFQTWSDYRRRALQRSCRYMEEDGRCLTKALLTGLDKYNNIFMMADPGRGSDKQIKQLAGMRGLMADTTGHTIELPIKLISVKVWTYWNDTLCLRMVRVKVCLIRLFVPLTPVTDKTSG